MFLETSGPGAQSAQVCVLLQRAPALLSRRDSGELTAPGTLLSRAVAGKRVDYVQGGAPAKCCPRHRPPGEGASGCPVSRLSPGVDHSHVYLEDEAVLLHRGGGQAALGRQPLGTAVHCLFAHEPTHNPQGQAGSGHVGGSDKLQELPLWRLRCAGPAWLRGRPLTCLSFLPGSPL